MPPAAAPSTKTTPRSLNAAWSRSEVIRVEERERPGRRPALPTARLCRSSAACASNRPLPPALCGATTTQRFPALERRVPHERETQLLREVRDGFVVVADNQSYQTDPLSHRRSPWPAIGGEPARSTGRQLSSAARPDDGVARHYDSGQAAGRAALLRSEDRGFQSWPIPSGASMPASSDTSARPAAATS